MATIEATYEHGVLRPVQPLDFAEGEHVRVTVDAMENTRTHSHDPEEVQRLVDEIAALPPEGPDPYAGWTHDEVVYGTRDTE